MYLTIFTHLRIVLRILSLGQRWLFMNADSLILTMTLHKIASVHCADGQKMSSTSSYFVVLLKLYFRSKTLIPPSKYCSVRTLCTSQLKLRPPDPRGIAWNLTNHLVNPGTFPPLQVEKYLLNAPVPGNV